MLLTYLDRMRPGHAFLGTTNLDVASLAERFQIRFQSPASSRLKTRLSRPSSPTPRHDRKASPPPATAPSTTEHTCAKPRLGRAARRHPPTARQSRWNQGFAAHQAEVRPPRNRHPKRKSIPSNRGGDDLDDLAGLRTAGRLERGPNRRLGGTGRGGIRWLGSDFSPAGNGAWEMAASSGGSCGTPAAALKSNTRVASIRSNDAAGGGAACGTASGAADVSAPAPAFSLVIRSIITRNDSPERLTRK